MDDRGWMMAKVWRRSLSQWPNEASLRARGGGGHMRVRVLEAHSQRGTQAGHTVKAFPFSLRLSLSLSLCLSLYCFYIVVGLCSLSDRFMLTKK